MIKRALIGMALALAASTVSARMYQWVDPQSRTTHLSGQPPGWYRLHAAGPRVFVFDAGRLIDDTARKLDPETAQALRHEAFAMARAVQQQPLDDPDARLRAILRGPDSGSGAQRPIAAPVASDRDPVGAAPSPEAGTAPAAGDEPEAVVERLRALLETWDRQQTARAREVLDSAR